MNLSLLDCRNMVEEAIGSCHYLLSQCWVDHYPHSKSRLYVNLGLINVALEACKGPMSPMLEHITHKYIDQLDHWYLWWSIISTIAGMLMVIGWSCTVRIRIFSLKLKLAKNRESFQKDLEVLEWTQASVDHEWSSWSHCVYPSHFKNLQISIHILLIKRQVWWQCLLTNHQPMYILTSPHALWHTPSIFLPLTIFTPFTQWGSS